MRRIAKPAPIVAGRRHVSPGALETQPTVVHIRDSTHPLPHPCGAKVLRTLHIPSDSRASTSCRSLSRRSSPPASLSVFQRSNGLAQVAMKRRNSFRETLLAPSNQAQAPVSVRCSTLGKNQIYLASSPPFGPNADESRHPSSKATPPPLVPSNGKSQGYSFRQNRCQQDSFLRPKLALNTLVAMVYAGNTLHKAKFSPNLRLVK